MILSCIRPHINLLLWTNQNGFHQGRSTVSQILTLHHLVEDIKEHNLSAILTFVDFKKAFDSTNREKMFDVLLAYGIPSQIVEGIKGLYIDIVAQVVTKEGNTNFFVAGVLQGDTLAPYLFIIILDYVMRITWPKTIILELHSTEKRMTLPGSLSDRCRLCRWHCPAHWHN